MTIPLAARAELESRVGVDPLAVLLADRATLVKKTAPLRAKYGPGGIWDAQRKQRLSQIQAVRRGQAVEAGKKITESQIDEQAHASEEYAAVITDALLERTEWALLEDRISAINEQIMRDNALIRYVSAEAMLAR